MMNMMNDPRLRTDSYAKIFLYNTHETVRTMDSYGCGKLYSEKP